MLQSFIWHSSLTPVPQMFNALDYGWQVGDNGNFVLLWTLLLQASMICHELIKCSCKKGCRGNCKCASFSLICTKMYYCICNVIQPVYLHCTPSTINVIYIKWHYLCKASHNIYRFFVAAIGHFIFISHVVKSHFSYFRLLDCKTNTCVLSRNNSKICCVYILLLYDV